jgi:hypothetical protein
VKHEIIIRIGETQKEPIKNALNDIKMERFRKKQKEDSKPFGALVAD